METTFDIGRYNEVIRAWGRGTKGKLPSSLNTLGVRGTGHLLRSINVKFGQRYGQVNYIGFRFARTGVFVEKGASRGHAGTKGSKWRDAKGQMKHTGKDGRGLMGMGNRPAKPWFNPVIEPAVQELADMVVEHIADAALNTIKIK